MATKCLVLLSGGLDSAVALYWALDQEYQVETITFDYYRRSRKEILACIQISKHTGCPNRKINLGFLKEIDDIKKETKNPWLLAAQSAYIPSRNLIFYGIASSYAEIGDARFIVGGHNKNDTRNFPDSSQSFFRLFNKTASFGRITKDRTGEVILPFAKLDKSEVLLLGARHKVPFEMTWSCYKS
ncbi:MAG TPA: 7-cyano-7-deazaguanine synthase, partial [Nitrososphaerales archaeon]|nr:7-cyano-7-deazaguanine synthase [Nitrososphaerales archaeon]